MGNRSHKPRHILTDSPEFLNVIGNPDLQLMVTSLTDKNATVVRVELTEDLPCDGSNKIFPSQAFWSATGSSKREQGDVSNPVVGRRLALARALHKLANDLKHDADLEVQAAVPQTNTEEVTGPSFEELNRGLALSVTAELSNEPLVVSPAQEKSLGQVAFEHFQWQIGNDGQWNDLPSLRKGTWENVAREVQRAANPAPDGAGTIASTPWAG